MRSTPDCFNLLLNTSYLRKVATTTPFTGFLLTAENTQLQENGGTYTIKHFTVVIDSAVSTFVTDGRF